MRPALKKPGCVFLHGERYQNRVWNACNKTFVLHKVCGSEQHSGHWPPAVLVAGGAAHTWDRNLTSVTVLVWILRPCLSCGTWSQFPCPFANLHTRDSLGILSLLLSSPSTKLLFSWRNQVLLCPNTRSGWADLQVVWVSEVPRINGCVCPRRCASDIKDSVFSKWSLENFISFYCRSRFWTDTNRNQTDRDSLNQIWVMNQTLLKTERGNVLGHGAFNPLTSEQVCMIPAAQLEGEKRCP